MGQVTADELVIRELVGVGPFLRGIRLATLGAVDLGHSSGHWSRGVVVDASQPFDVEVITQTDHEGRLLDFRELCDCDLDDCHHGVALLVTVLRRNTGWQARPSWEVVLARLTDTETDSTEGDFALLFELALPDGSTSSKRHVDHPELQLRPGTRAKKGHWVRQGITWSTLARPYYGTRELPDHQRRVLLELFVMAGNSTGYQYSEPVVDLAEVHSRRLWDLLAEVAETGLPLVQPGANAGPVHVHADPVAFSLTLARTTAGLALRPTLESTALPDDAPPPPRERRLLLGSPAHGLAWWQPEDRSLHLARFETPLETGSVNLLEAGEVRVPASDADRFLTEAVPRVRRKVRLQAGDDVEIPEVHPPRLQCLVTREPSHRVTVEWEWVYQVGSRRIPVPFAGGPHHRDHGAEQALVQRVFTATDYLVVAHEELSGMGAVLFLTETLPRLEALPEVDVVVENSEDLEEEPAYVEFGDDPVITLADHSAPGEARDWFDLAITVQVNDETVPFNALFTALALNDTHLLLPSGTYFRLDREEFHQLGALIAESRALTDTEGDVVRLGRFQAGLWEELERIGVVAGQAAEWQKSIGRLRSVTEIPEHPVPTGLKADLRAYQVAGFNWLAALYDLGLGGVLADDMGLGKTVQTLALITHLRERAAGGGRASSDRPFLVVAPTSVASNWASEAARFTPDLEVAVVAETRARRGVSLADAVRGVDLVVTTYTLFRLKYDEYAELPWAGLVLDEAQSVKNHQGRGYQCARRLPVPFKLAITGTPMENNLMELWALLSITAPGLFPNPAKFTEYYRTPIEKERNAELLAQLRRRVRPLMLRRTKEQVATDLPPKQEQVLELELNPKHRKAYQTYLARERQKVLGLLGDFERNRFEIFRSLTMLRQAALDVTLVDANAHASVTSTKLDELLELVGEVAREGHRVLVFSQFTRYLTKARHTLEAAGLITCYLDGKTRDRAGVIKSFKEGDAPVFLISLKAGGFGLNLTEADYCVVLDPWWNPATEAQAVDRAHRIGQTKNVMVYRMVAKGTIEEKVMALKAEKSALFAGVMGDGAFESGALTAADVRGLFD